MDKEYKVAVAGTGYVGLSIDTSVAASSGDSCGCHSRKG